MLTLRKILISFFVIGDRRRYNYKEIAFTVLLVSSLSLAGICRRCRWGTVQIQSDNNSTVQEKVNIHIFAFLKLK